MNFYQNFNEPVELDWVVCLCPCACRAVRDIARVAHPGGVGFNAEPVHM